MKIFFFFSILHQLYCEVAKVLQQHDPTVEFSGILYGRDQLRDLQRSRFPSKQLWVLTEELSRELPLMHRPESLLADWEKRHGVSLSTILSSDRRYYTFPREEGLKIVAIVIRCCKDLLDRIRPDVIVGEGTDDLLSLVLYYSARERSIPYLITYASPAPNRIAIYGNAGNHWEKVEEIYLRLRESSLTQEQRTRAAGLIREYREKDILPTYLKGGYNRLFSGRELPLLYAVARRNRLDRSHRLDPSYSGTVAEVLMRKSKRVFRAAISARRYFQQPVKGERYVFFPLQMEPECSTLVFAPFYTNQLHVIECLAKSLPIDHLLYVKEHPVMQGRRPLSFYRAARSLPNVRLISPGMISHQLIRSASAVAVITSSVGWEALMHGKPVIVLGNVWFDACNLVRKIRAMSDLPGVLREAITDHKPDREILLKFVTASLEGTYPGRIEHPDYSPSILSAENVAAVADAIRQHLEWLGQGSSIAHEMEAQSAVS